MIKQILDAANLFRRHGQNLALYFNLDPTSQRHRLHLHC